MGSAWKNWKGKMKKIKLTQGKFALVDDEDFEALSKHNWHVGYNAPNQFYAKRWGKVCEKRNGQILMHREIMKTPDELQVDHINGNKLDNRKCNLRNCTHAQNQMNKAKAKNASSKFKGVRWDKKKNIWSVELRISGEIIHIGRYHNQIEAARAYDESAKKYHGEFAYLNKA
jgi:hypothetical protein